MTDKITGQAKGFAYLEFVDAESVQKAVDTLDGSTFRERQLKVLAKRTNIPGINVRVEVVSEVVEVEEVASEVVEAVEVVEEEEVVSEAEEVVPDLILINQFMNENGTIDISIK